MGRSEELKAPRGTRDILPDKVEIWDSLFDTASKMFSQYGYGRIDTPIFESTDVFARAIGETTDIVKKEMYSFKDRKGRDLTLRPEATAPIVRAYIEHKLYVEFPAMFKVFYYGPMFRYERPQAGRQRQFWQIGVEAIGSPRPGLDAEVINMAMQYVGSIGLEEFKLHINSVGDKSCRPDYTKRLKGFLKENQTDLCVDCQSRAKTNPMRVFDCKNKKCIDLLKNAPLISESLCKDCHRHFKDVKRYLRNYKIDFNEDPRLVRGLDYYTRTTFELKSSKMGAQDAICAGGRYDNLVEQYGGPDKPAIGFAIGMERLIMAIGEQGIKMSKRKQKTDVYFAVLGDEAELAARIEAQYLVKEGVRVEVDSSGKSLKGQMKLADRSGAKYSVIIGEDELKRGLYTIRDMISGEQESVDAKEIRDWLNNKKKG